MNDGGETDLIPRITEPPSNQRLSSAAVQTLYESHAKELLAFLIGVLRDPSAAQDVSQMTFHRLVEVGHTAREETMKGWLFKVAMREALVYRRQDSLRERHLTEYSRQREASLGTGTEPLDDDLEKAETMARLRQLLAQLPPDQQYVVLHRIYEGKTFAAIADELNVPLGTVLTRMRIALEKVRKWLG